MATSDVFWIASMSKPVIVYVFMIQRADLRPNPDDSPMRRALQDAVAAALAPRS